MSRSPVYYAMQRQMAVTAYFESEKILSFVFVVSVSACVDGIDPVNYNAHSQSVVPQPPFVTYRGRLMASKPIRLYRLL